MCKKQEIQILLERKKKNIMYTCTHAHTHIITSYIYTYT